MNIKDIIIKKRDKHELSKNEIDYFIKGVVDNSIADYQISALLMAIFINGLSDNETTNLTMSMANNGKRLNLSEISGIKVDKHSTGGVADTTTLILAPLVASCGVPVVKMSGRGLGFTGGTLDKLESIPGLRTSLSDREAIDMAKQTNLVIMGQTEDIAPADKKLYSLRDVTSTVDNISLIASSIMSKKIAAGADVVVLDVKCGSGAFMKDYESANALAEKMLTIGKGVGIKISAIISSMDQPLGNYIGNSFEVIEAIEVLKGNINGELLEVALTLGAHMLKLAGKCSNIEYGKKLLRSNIDNGEAIKKLRQMIKAQNGNDKVVDDYSLLPIAKQKYEYTAPTEGYIFGMNSALIGKASVEAGAGRLKKDDIIDYGAGIIMKKRVGDYVKAGDVIAEIYAKNINKCLDANENIKEAILIKKEEPKKIPSILNILE